MFKQNTLSGHGNYTVGIAQDGEMKRVIFNMDSNGCTGASGKSRESLQTMTYEHNTYGIREAVYGLQKDQVAWFEATATEIKKDHPNAKLSMHFHVPMNYVYTAMNNAYKDKVGYDPVAMMEVTNGNYDYNDRYLVPERIVGHTEGDFGLLRSMYSSAVIDCWDTDKTNGAGTQDQIFNKMKAKGIDSILLGHMHSSSASIVYDGIRYQFGQKCSLYDSVPTINNNTGKMDYINGAYALDSYETALVGGTVMKLDSTGAIVDAYIEYNTGYGKEINWSQYYNTIGK